MSRRQGVSKWQIKSTRVNQIRWELGELLEKELSDEEKQSDKYEELVESVESVFKHVVPPTRRRFHRSAWRMTLLISVASSGGAILLKLLEFLVTLFTVTNNIGGTP